MLNPVRQARKAKGLTIKEFAVVLGVPYSAVSGVETGLLTQIPATWEAGMTQLGMDYQAMQKAYMEWRNLKGMAILEGMQYGNQAKKPKA